MNSGGQYPPACRKAVARITQAPAMKPINAGPTSGSPASGLAAMGAQAGSGAAAGPTSTRALSTATSGWRSSTSAARARAPGNQQTSSSQKAT